MQVEVMLPEPDSSSLAAICPPLLLGGANLLSLEWEESVLEAPRAADQEGAGMERRRRRKT